MSGVVVPSLTFYNKKNEINIEIQSLLIRHLLVNGADSIYLFGVTGEGRLFSNNRTQKIKIINLTLELTGKKTPIIVGILGNELEEIIDELDELGKKFDNLNFVLSPPLIEKRPDLDSYFTEIFDSINIKNQIFLSNNPKEFAGNELNPNFIKKLLDIPNFSGFIDSFDNINYSKSYIQMINQNFSLLCGKEENFQKFLQLIPLNLRKYCGIIPTIGNLVNIASKLFFCAIEDKILDLHQIQDQLNDIRKKIYDFKLDKGKEQRGLKYAFLYLYRDIIQASIEEHYNVNAELQRELDQITKGRIQATVNYLLNQKAIYQLFSLSKEEIYQLDDIINTFSNIEVLIKQGKIKKIIGPYDAEINTIYRVNFENSQLVFRFRTLKSFKYENLIKEKVLFPLLDGSLNPNLGNFREKVKEMIAIKKGDYIFNKDNPPIIPVGNLIYYDETKQLIPYLFSIQEYIHGKSLENLYSKYKGEIFSFNKSKFLNLFSDIGEILGKLHNIKFNSFQPDIYNLGNEAKSDWSEIINSEFEDQIQEAKKYKFNQEKEMKDYIKEHFYLLEDETEPILIHNDFQWKNIIIKDDPIKFQIKGIIDFDSWRIGVRAQDFVRMENITFKSINHKDIKLKFYEGYQKFCKIDEDFYKKIDLYSLLSYMKDYNSAMENQVNGEFLLAEIKHKLNVYY
ncbi:MAG: dihydrodipicolinate synthase family protein [Candidatus Hodarchaeota archaeon]